MSSPIFSTTSSTWGSEAMFPVASKSGAVSSLIVFLAGSPDIFSIVSSVRNIPLRLAWGSRSAAMTLRPCSANIHAKW